MYPLVVAFCAMPLKLFPISFSRANNDFSVLTAEDVDSTVDDVDVSTAASLVGVVSVSFVVSSSLVSSSSLLDEDEEEDEDEPQIDSS